MPRIWTSSHPEILLDMAGGGPLHSRLERALREAVRSGRLHRGMALPSTRALARDLGVSRGVVVEAYEQLVAEGYLVARAGSKTVVAAAAPTTVDESTASQPSSPDFDFRPGVPDLTRFPREKWTRAIRRAMQEVRPAQLSYGDPRGDPALREALRDYLGRVRGVVACAGHVVVCNGFAQGLSMIASALREQGHRRLGLEDPCHPDLRRIVTSAGLAPVGVPVDGGGLRVDLLDRLDLRAVLVTPAHQFPTGSVLCASRRQHLVEWASRGSAYVIEDDYDAEYRYDREPVGALQGLAPERVIYTGSASKILAPALRLGWIVAPPALSEPLAQRKRDADLAAPVLEQLAYAEFLRDGGLDRHLRRMRAIYRSRRDALIAALLRYFPDWSPSGIAAGMHLVARLPTTLDEIELRERAAARSVRVYPMRDYSDDATREPALVFGYGSLDEGAIARGIERLAIAVETLK